MDNVLSSSPARPIEREEEVSLIDKDAKDKSTLTLECPDAGHKAQIDSATSRILQKKEHLAAQIVTLHQKIEQAQKELNEANAKLGDMDAAVRVKRHIALLHQYNEIKDVGMGLFGLIADRRGVRVRDVFEEFGVVEAD